MCAAHVVLVEGQPASSLCGDSFQRHLYGQLGWETLVKAQVFHSDVILRRRSLFILCLCTCRKTFLMRFLHVLLELAC